MIFSESHFRLALISNDCVSHIFHRLLMHLILYMHNYSPEWTG